MTLPPPVPTQDRPQSEAAGGTLRIVALTLLVLGSATAAVVCALQSRNGRGPSGQLRYDGTAYFFCSLTCAGTFADDPERFAN